MNIIIGCVILIAGAGLGVILDGYYGISKKNIYWFIGAISGIIAGALI